MVGTHGVAILVSAGEPCLAARVALLDGIGSVLDFPLELSRRKGK